MSNCSNCNTCSSCCSNCSDNWTNWNWNNWNRSGCNDCNNCNSRNWNNWNRSGCSDCNNCNSWNWNTWNRSGCSDCNNCNSWNWNNWNWNNWNWINWGNWNCWWNNWLLDSSGRSRWAQPIVSSPAQFSNAGTAEGATLVIHRIVLEPCGNQSCTPRTFNIRITGPSYPCGEIFQMRAGNCLELDEPLVITGLEPGTYCIEEIFNFPNEYISTFTGPVCGRQVTVTNSWSPTVITICSRKRLCRLCHGFGCGCSSCSSCG